MKRLISLPFQDWPDADQRMWTFVFSGDDLFSAGGTLAHLRLTSRSALIKHYGRWLEWLRRTEPTALCLPPAERATPERLSSWIATLHHVAPPTLHTFVFGALQILFHGAPEHDWATARRITTILQRKANQWSSPRKVGRILDSTVLFQLARDLMGPKAEAANTPLNAALCQRNGAMIAFLTFLPIRLRSFSELCLGRSVQISPGRVVISLTPDMTKTGRHWEAPVPEVLAPLLWVYLQNVRPWLMRNLPAPHSKLWVGRMGEPYTCASIANTIPRVTKREVGVAISPHLFRDTAATFLVRQSPEDARLIRALLGHASFETAERHYIHAQGIEAGRDYAAVIADLTREDR